MSQQIEGSSPKSTLGVSMDLPVRSFKKKKSSKASDSDADLIRENKNPSQEILSSSSTKISMDSAPKTCPGKKKKSVSVKAKKRSLKLKGQDKKEPIKTRHIQIANPKISEGATKANLSDRNLRTEEASEKTMLKWLELGLESPPKNMPSTSKIRSQKRDLKNKSSEYDTLSVPPEEGSSEDISSKKDLKSSEIIVSDDKTLTPGKITHLKSRKHEKKTRQTLKKAKRMSQETARPKELGSTSKNKSTKKQSSESINSNDVTPKKKTGRKACNNKKKPPTKPTKTTSLDLDNLSGDILRQITMQEIFDSDTFPPEALMRKMRASETNLPEQSESFKKYGVEIPTVQEILASRKKFAIYSALVDKAKIIPLTPNPFINIPKEPDKPPMKLLDCKHVSLEEIKEQFIENKTTLLNIKNGTQYSEKHQHFQRTNSNLPPYNPSNLVFSYPQINCMANLIREEFDPDEKHLRYTFGVLIPELCLLIFMYTHKMTKEETVKYLDERPIEESDSSSTISMDSTPKTCSGKKKISVGGTAKPKLKLKGRAKKERIANPKLSESATKEKLSEEDLRSEKRPQKTIFKLLESPTNNNPSTSKMRSRKRESENNSSEDDALSVTPEADSFKDIPSVAGRTPKKVKRMSLETDISPPEAPTENRCDSKTTAKENISKTQKKRKKTALDSA